MKEVYHIRLIVRSYCISLYTYTPSFLYEPLPTATIWSRGSTTEALEGGGAVLRSHVNCKKG